MVTPMALAWSLISMPLIFIAAIGLDIGNTARSLTAHGSGSVYSTRRGEEYASSRSSSLRSPMWICSRLSTLGTGTTSANSESGPW